MKRLSTSERILLEELALLAQKTRAATKGLSIGALVRIIRKQLGMSQKNLAERSKVPQSTISYLEKDQKNLTLSTVSKILKALSCDLLIVPLLQESIDTIRQKQARKVAEKHMRYLKGTMNLENQQPDPRFIEELLKQEERQLLQGPSSKLWEE